MNELVMKPNSDAYGKPKICPDISSYTYAMVKLRVIGGIASTTESDMS